MGKDCTTCKYGSWGFSALYPKESEERCNKCSGLFNEWVRKDTNDEMKGRIDNETMKFYKWIKAKYPEYKDKKLPHETLLKLEDKFLCEKRGAKHNEKDL